MSLSEQQIEQLNLKGVQRREKIAYRCKDLTIDRQSAPMTIQFPKLQHLITTQWIPLVKHRLKSLWADSDAPLANLSTIVCTIQWQKNSQPLYQVPQCDSLRLLHGYPFDRDAREVEWLRRMINTANDRRVRHLQFLWPPDLNFA